MISTSASQSHPCLSFMRLWSTTLFLRRHSLEDYILKYLNVTLSLKLHPLPRLRPQRFDLRSDLNLNHEASLRPPCFCRKSAEKIRTVVTQWFGFLKQEWFERSLFYLIVTLFYNLFRNIHKEMRFIKQSRRTAVWVEWRMRQTCLTTPRALTAFNGVKNQICQSLNVKILQNVQKSCWKGKNANVCIIFFSPIVQLWGITSVMHCMLIINAVSNFLYPKQTFIFLWPQSCINWVTVWIWYVDNYLYPFI